MPRPAPLDGAEDGVVVVGAGVAGVSAAAALRRLGYDRPVTLVDAGAFPHDRPPLSKAFLLGSSQEDDIRLQPAAWYAEADVRLLAGTEVVGLGAGTGGGHRLSLSDGRVLAAATVVLAQGGTARPLPVPGGELARTLRTVQDARALREALRPGVALVVVGAGLVGAEVAATAVALGVRVDLVDPDPLPLSGAVGPVVARVLHEDHARHGVRVHRAGVASLAADPGGGVLVRLDDGRALAADVVLAATGMRGVDDLARASGLELSPAGGVLVDDHARTSRPGVLAVGDMTSRRQPDGTSVPSPGHWDAARTDGERAAAVVLGQDPSPRPSPWFWSDRHGRHVEVVGDPQQGRTLLRGTPGTDPFTVLAWARGRVLGAVSVDDPRTARAARRLLDRGVVVDPDVLVQESTDLRRLVRG